MTEKTGTEQTKRFYDEKGWKKEDGSSVDHHLFGVKEDGPIRRELHRLHIERIRRALSVAGAPLNMLECGCGGNPARDFLDLCARYTGADFSETGIELARSNFSDVRIPYEFRVADVCALPFATGTFDAVYCAHMIYHIADPLAQEAAIAELLRVARPGGVVVLIVANPRPLVFPVRLAKRLAADTPGLAAILNRIRPAPVLPYKPMPIAWMRERLARGGDVTIEAYSIPSTSFFQNTTEYGGFGGFLWKGIRWLDFNHPRLSAYLGNYVLMTCVKSSGK